MDLTGNEMMERAKQLVREYIEDVHEKTDPKLASFEVYVVWFTKTLQNWKALVSTTIPDGKYYEITYNGDKKETYVDVYVKVANFAVGDVEA